MKNGYEQFFKQAKTVAREGHSASKPMTSAEMAEKLRESVIARRAKGKLKTKKKTMSWKLAGFSFLALVIASFAFYEFDLIENVVRHVEIGVFGQAKAQAEVAVVETKSTESTQLKTELPSVPTKEPQESVSHLKLLIEREKQLDAREQELKQMETELQAQKDELDARLKSLEGTRREISSVLEDKVKMDEEKLETLVQVYTNMKPQQAAKVFENMDEGLAIEILGRMKKKSAAEVMNLLKSEKAQVLSEKYAGYRKK